MKRDGGGIGQHAQALDYHANTQRHTDDAINDALVGDEMVKHVDYSPVAAALEEIWKAVADSNGMPVASCQKALQSEHVRRFIERRYGKGQTLGPPLLARILGSDEFIAYRYDVLQTKVLAAEKAALENIENTMADVIIREVRTRNNRLQVSALYRAKAEAEMRAREAIASGAPPDPVDDYVDASTPNEFMVEG